SGIEVLKTGDLPVRVESRRDELLAIRDGQIPWEEVDRLRLSLHTDFERAFEHSTLPDRPDYERANALLIAARREMVRKEGLACLPELETWVPRSFAAFERKAVPPGTQAHESLNALINKSHYGPAPTQNRSRSLDHPRRQLRRLCRRAGSKLRYRVLSTRRP